MLELIKVRMKNKYARTKLSIRQALAMDVIDYATMRADMLWLVKNLEEANRIIRERSRV